MLKSPMLRRRLAVVTVLTAPAVALAGCGGGGTINAGSVVALVKKHIRQAGGTPNSVQCPSTINDLPSQTVSCSVSFTLPGKTEIGTVQVLLHHSGALKYTFVPGGTSTGTTTS